jgi:peptide deformylase
MKLPTIVTVPHPLLRHTLAPVTLFDTELIKIASIMIAVMHEAAGVGLAANQINLDKRLFVYGIEESFTLGDQQVAAVSPTIIINPIITLLGNTPLIQEEGCLSIPGLWGPVPRAASIKIRAQDVQGKYYERIVSGYEARIIQHETDHLNGKLFLDYITDPSKIRVAEPDNEAD